jgi:hypothetical protein
MVRSAIIYTIGEREPKLARGSGYYRYLAIPTGIPDYRLSIWFHILV